MFEPEETARYLQGKYFLFKLEADQEYIKSWEQSSETDDTTVIQGEKQRLDQQSPISPPPAASQEEEEEKEEKLKKKLTGGKNTTNDDMIATDEKLLRKSAVTATLRPHTNSQCRRRPLLSTYGTDWDDWACIFNTKKGGGEEGYDGEDDYAQEPSSNPINLAMQRFLSEFERQCKILLPIAGIRRVCVSLDAQQPYRLIGIMEVLTLSGGPPSSSSSRRKGRSREQYNLLPPLGIESKKHRQIHVKNPGVKPMIPSLTSYDAQVQFTSLVIVNSFRCCRVPFKRFELTQRGLLVLGIPILKRARALNTLFSSRVITEISQGTAEKKNEKETKDNQRRRKQKNEQVGINL